MIAYADLKLALRVESDVEQDYIEGLEEAAVEFVESWKRKRYRATGTRTHYVTGNGTGSLFLPEPLAADGIAITESSYTGATAATLVAADADGYELRDGVMLRKGGAVWATGYTYAVTGTFGYAADAFPKRIRQAVTMIVTHWFENRVPVAIGNITEDVPLTVQALLGGRPTPLI